MAQRFEGKNLEDALSDAAQTLGVERYQLTYHVLMEKRGFLGGMKRIVIEAEINTQTPEQVAAVAAPPGRGFREERGPRGGNQRRGGRVEGRDELRGRGERRNRPRKSEEGRDEAEPFVPDEAAAETAVSDIAGSAGDWC